jgi:hypothetical protein
VVDSLENNVFGFLFHYNLCMRHFLWFVLKEYIFPHKIMRFKIPTLRPSLASPNSVHDREMFYDDKR